MLEFNEFNLRISPLWQRLFRVYFWRDATWSDVKLNVLCLVLEFNGLFLSSIHYGDEDFSREFWGNLCFALEFNGLSERFLNQSLPGLELTGLIFESLLHHKDFSRKLWCDATRHDAKQSKWSLCWNLTDWCNQSWTFRTQGKDFFRESFKLVLAMLEFNGFNSFIFPVIAQHRKD